ncbi:RagB/SusD family nutrient uptake outer membrane protein [Salinimicrobium soli]|uniref:RagB/SusD family nutrient uptake outer membrane protein n=1 Tax=Salinimicrobium soli TaxID=1254399 RepID=UPI003AAA5EFE
MKYFKISFLFASLLLLGSCDNAIDVAPADEIVESNAITNVKDVGDAVIGVYSTVSNTSDLYWDALFTDELTIAPQNNGQGIQVHTWSITSGEGNGIYGSHSTTINRINRVLEAIEGITADTPEEEALLQRYKGELLGLRAYSHFQMAVYYTPSMTDLNALSVPYVDYVVVLQTPNRNTLGEVLAGINSDLDQAQSLIPDSFEEVYFFNADAITALRSRIALYTRDYAAAINYSTQLINKYSLPTISEYPLVWTDDIVKGQIFKLARVAGDGAVGQLFNPNPSLTYFNPSTKLLEAYQADDVRKDVFFDAQNRIVKYPGTAAVIGLNDLKIFRISEQYLIRMEAYLRQSSPNIAGAEADYNTLRRNRIPNYVDADFTTSAAAIPQVLEERYRELAYEGFRFIDLKRTARPVDRNDADCEDLAADACFLEASSYLWALPIPQSEIFVNDEMIQNPGY